MANLEKPPSNGQPFLLHDHERLVVDSGISPEVIGSRGYRSVTSKSELRSLGFGNSQCRVPALLIPIWTVAGTLGLYQIRPDVPRIKDGKPLKYETPASARMILDVPPLARQRLVDPKIPLFITEGARKADAAVSHGLCCIALLGVWNFRGTNEDGGKVNLIDWDSIALNGRRIFIVFDSDVMEKLPVHQALIRLIAFLESRGAEVLVIYLPPRLDGGKMGLDDFLATGHSVEDLLAHASVEVRRFEAPQIPSSTTYRKTETGLVWDKPTANGIVTVPLTNFSASIAADIVEDDGTETMHMFEIEAQLNGRGSRLTIPASQFPSMNWAVEHLGGQAIVYPGLGIKDHARCAIQTLSGEIVERRVYTHLGWRLIDAEWVYLHAHGAITKSGMVEHVQVQLPLALSHYQLPPPPQHQTLRDCVSTSLSFLATAPETVSVPLFASIWRAAMGSLDFAIHLVGPTGAGKSELAALVQQHWGRDMTARLLPGNWSSTGNALEGLAHAAKDAILTIDDFAPTGTLSDTQRLHREADRIFRAQGNRSGRQRMRSDATLRPVKPPRGLILSTGEDIPKGQSLRARLLLLECSPDAINWPAVTAAQEQARQGVFAQALAAFIQWLAARYSYLAESLALETFELRQLAHKSGNHRRTAQILADLGIGMRYFLTFAQEAGVFSMEQSAQFWNQSWQVLGEVSLAQKLHHLCQEPAQQFITLLSSALGSGRAHVASETGEAPTNPSSWGWRKMIIGNGSLRDDWEAKGERVGWIRDGELLLEPEASYAVVKKMAHDLGDSLNVSAQTLRRRLHERGHLASIDSPRRTLTVRRTLEGRQRNVLHLNAEMLAGSLSGDADKSDTAAIYPPSGDSTNVGFVGSQEHKTGTSPNVACYSCGGKTFWRSIHGSTVCQSCHPPASPDLVARGEEAAS